MARLRKTAVEIVNLFCIVFLDISEKRVASVFSGVLKVPCPAIRNLCERLSMTADDCFHLRLTVNVALISLDHKARVTQVNRL